MTLRVFDTKANFKRVFHLAEPGVVRIYVCGPTVYDDAHIGHARSYVSFDVMRRYLEHTGREVRIVINITDVDDVIDARAARLGKTPESVAGLYERRFLEDMRALNVKPSYANPRVSENVHHVGEIIKELKRKGYVYEVDGNHYFRVSLAGGYGQLTHRSPEELLADAAGGGPREHPLDFLIWKNGTKGMRTWDSPLGPGRPGWHIQCYAIMLKWLGDRIDIHGGGEDLKFPHHESNILISTAHQGRDITDYYIHNGFITLGKEKMSKSIGNFVSLRNLLKRFDGPTIRFYILSTHYREKIDYDEKDIERARLKLDAVLALIKELREIELSGGVRETIKRGVASSRKRFMNSMDDDFDTSSAISVLLELVEWMTPLLAGMTREEAQLALGFLEEADGILGLTGEN